MACYRDSFTFTLPLLFEILSAVKNVESLAKLACIQQHINRCEGQSHELVNPLEILPVFCPLDLLINL
jgi:hypothetical protein